MRLALCVPTYKRPQLLRLLLADAARQSIRPDTLVIVDGDPASGEVRAMLNECKTQAPWRIVYVPSNHANLAYQRYLAYLAAREHDHLLYLDDDLRLAQPEIFDNLLQPFASEGSPYVAGTSIIRFPESLDETDGAVRDRFRDSRQKLGRLVRWFGNAARAKPGGLTPTGNRIAPLMDSGPYADVEWLRGGVMIFRCSALSEDFFSDDLFALTMVRCGLGEDTFLGRRALSRGKVFLARNATVDHPNADAPKAYPTQAFRMGFATAYSRRFINDTYRGFHAPTAGDRLSLVRSLAGGVLLAMGRTMREANARRGAYALGFIAGALKAATVRPTARNLAPKINWRRDAAADVARSERC